MQTLPYHLVNVFSESHFGGNPLAVFPHADGLTDQQMQKIAQQFNLSETVFIFAPTDLYSEKVVANLRIFTPNYELPLAGHPTLGSGFILHKLKNLPNEFVINTQAKPVRVTAENSKISMQIHGFDYQKSSADRTVLAKICGLMSDDITDYGYYINSGTPQLLIQLNSHSAIQHLKIDLAILREIYQENKFQIAKEPSLYVWYDAGDKIHARMQFEQNSNLVEDSGTGSACANLGAYFILQGQFPIEKAIFQGDDIGRPNRLSLRVDSEQNIFVGGNVIEVGKGEFYLPSLTTETLKS